MLGFKTDATYFNLLSEQGNAIFRAAEIIRLISLDTERAEMYIAQMDLVLNESNEFATELLNRVVSVFISPLDKEDFQILTRTLQNTVEGFNNIILLFGEFKITKTLKNFQKIAELLVELGGLLKEVVDCLHTKKRRQEMTEVLRQIRRLKSETHRVCWKTLGDMIEDQKLNSRTRLKWSNIIERIDRSLFDMLRVVEVLELLSIKYA